MKKPSIQLAPSERIEVDERPESRDRRIRTLQRMASDTVSTESVLITPEQALAWLECCNLKNRAVSHRRVETYVAEMKAKRWKLTHQGIAFGKDGSLFDGQHRLWAIVESNQAIEMSVTIGLDEDARPGIDKGRVRGVGDELQMFAGKSHGGRLFSVLRALAALLGEPQPTSQGGALELEARFAEGINWVMAKMPRTAGLNGASAPVAAALALAYKADPAKVDEFASQVLDGEGLHSGDPALAFRRYFERDSGVRDRRNSRNISLRALRCALAQIHDEKFGDGKIPPVTETPLAFFAKANGLKPSTHVTKDAVNLMVRTAKSKAKPKT